MLSNHILTHGIINLMNDFRKFLKPEQILTINEEAYHIEKLLAVSEKLFTYIASKNGHQYLLKEYYPLNDIVAIDRNDTALITSNDETFKTLKLNYLQDIKAIYSTIVPLDISSWLPTYEAPIIVNSDEYNAIYVIESFDNAVCYKEVHETSVYELIANLLSLVRLTSAIHDQGYLIFNLEPKNIILRSYHGHNYLSLLDYDCLSLNHHFNLSNLNDKYLASEVITNDVAAFNETLDNYAIGMILKERLEELHDTHLHWRLNELLKEIIEHTIAPLDERFSDEKLLVGLLKCLDFAKIKHTLCTPTLNMHNFYGHAKEYKQLSNLLSKNKLAVISGERSSGKRGLAYHYAYNHRFDYANIQIVDFDLSWPRTFRNLNFVHKASKDAQLNELMADLTLALDKTLLIVNNYQFVEDDPWLKYLLSLDLKLILSTSTKIKGSIFVKPLNLEEAYDLFNNCYAKKLSEQASADLKELLPYFKGNPGLIKLVAKTLKYRHQPIILSSNIVYYLNEIRKKDENLGLHLRNGQVIFKTKKFDHQTYELMKLLYFFSEITFTKDQIISLGFKEQLLITLSYENIIIFHGSLIALNHTIACYFDDLVKTRNLKPDFDYFKALAKLNDPNINLSLLMRLKTEDSLYTELTNVETFLNGDLSLIKHYLMIHENETAAKIYDKRLNELETLMHFLLIHANDYQALFNMRENKTLESLYQKAHTAINEHQNLQAVALLNEINYHLIHIQFDDEALARNFFEIANLDYEEGQDLDALKNLDAYLKLLANNPSLEETINHRPLLQLINEKLG